MKSSSDRNLGTKRLREVEDFPQEDFKKPCYEEKDPHISASANIGWVQGKSKLTDSSFEFPFRFVQQDLSFPFVTLSLLRFGKGASNRNNAVVNIKVDSLSTALIKSIGGNQTLKTKNENPCLLQTNGIIAEDGLLVIAPEPVHCSKHSKYNSRKRIVLNSRASLVLVDWFCSDEQLDSWSFREFRNEIELLGETNREVLLHKFQSALNAEMNESSENANIFNISSKKKVDFHVCGTVLLFGTKTKAIRESINNQLNINSAEVQISPISTDLTMLKFMTSSVQEGYELLVQLLTPLGQELLGIIPYSNQIHYNLH